MDKPKLIKYICNRCRYKFSIKEGSKVALRCPYCGREDVTEDTFSLDEAIRESE